jgi:hypothetical protein
MSRKLSTFASALLIAFAFAARAQSAPTREELFTTVEIEGWDFSSYDEKIREAVTKAGVKGAGESERRAAAAALAERANFFRDVGLPTFYKYALGDYRHALRFRPDDTDSKEKADEIVSIYESMKRPVPQNGNAKSGDIYLVEMFKTTPKLMAFEADKTYDHRGDLPGRAAFVYEFAALAGQRLSVDVRPHGWGGEQVGRSNAVFDLYLEDARGRAALVEGAARKNYTLPAEGKYLIRVYSKAGQTDYFLQVRLN